MIRVTALTAARDDPPSRFRVRQFIEPLRASGIDVSEYYPLLSKYTTKRLPPLGMAMRLPGMLAARSSAVTWFGRELLPGRCTLERYAGRKRIFDVDDAIWLLHGSGFSERIATLCDGVIAGNQFIADHYRAYGARVWTIPTSLDTLQWRPGDAVDRANWTIGWTGTSSNLTYLSLLEEPLADFLAEHAEARLLIVCDRRPALNKLPAHRWQFVRWSRENEVRLIQSMDVGLMPLPDTEWARGKCALKMIMYLAVGIPAITSPVGVGWELLAHADVGIAARTRNDWHEALCRLWGDPQLARKMGAEGRALVEERFSVSRNVSTLAEIIGDIARA